VPPRLSDRPATGCQTLRVEKSGKREAGSAKREAKSAWRQAPCGKARQEEHGAGSAEPVGESYLHLLESGHLGEVALPSGGESTAQVGGQGEGGQSAGQGGEGTSCGKRTAYPATWRRFFSTLKVAGKWPMSSPSTSRGTFVGLFRVRFPA